jgi:hypothetical protein
LVINDAILDASIFLINWAMTKSLSIFS